jgi:DNA repair exonuclease SbcCD ATPase subunit
MLTKIELNNFQPHKKLQTDIAPITIISGKSDSGKSSIVRSLQWLLYNRGSAKEFLRHGANEVMVSCEIDGHTVTRSSQHNSYTLDGVQSRVVGKSVPDDIAALFNVISDNTQTQHDPFYWFTENGSGLVAKIEDTFGLNMPAGWVHACKQEQNQSNRDLKQYETEQQNLIAEIAALELYEKANEKLVKVDQANAILVEIRAKSDTLQKLAGGLIKFRMGFLPRHILDGWELLVDTLCKQQKLLDLNGQCVGLQKSIVNLPDIDKLHTAFVRHKTISTNVERLKTLKHAHTEVAAIKPLPDYIPLLNVLQRVLSVSVLLNNYQKRKYEAEQAKEDLIKVESQVSKLSGQLCPTCGGTIG